MKHSSQNVRLCRWFLVLFAAGCIATGLLGQAGRAPSSESTQLELGNTIEGQLAGGQSHEYHFTVQAGQYVRVLVEQHSINVTIACFGPNGRELVVADSFEIGDAESAELISEDGGSYRLRVTASEMHAPSGRYAITLRDIEPAKEQHKMRIAAARSLGQAMALSREGDRESMLNGVKHLDDALAQWRALHDLVEQARILYMISLTYLDIGNQQEALKAANDALALARAPGDRQMEGRA